MLSRIGYLGAETIPIDLLVFDALCKDVIPQSAANHFASLRGEQHLNLYVLLYKQNNRFLQVIPVKNLLDPKKHRSGK